MSEQRNWFVVEFGAWSWICLVIIAVSLLIIAFKPVPQSPQIQFPTPDNDNDIIQLGSNRIAIVDSNPSSEWYGRIIVYDYDDKNGTFKLAGKFDYSKDFHNLQLFTGK